MILPHYSMLKALNGITVLSGVAVYVVDPTVQVAIIMASSTAFSTLVTVFFGYLIRKDNRELKTNQEEMKRNVNGALSKLISDKELQASVLLNTKENLAHAEGRIEGIVTGTVTPVAVEAPSEAGTLKDLTERVAKMENERR